MTRTKALVVVVLLSAGSWAMLAQDERPAGSGLAPAGADAASRIEENGPVPLPAGVAEALAGVRFEPNEGQWPEATRAVARAPGLEAHLRTDRIDVLSEGSSFAIVLPRAVEPVLEGPRAAKTHYYLGQDPAAWRAAVPNFDRVRYPDVSPGIDLVLHGARGALEMDHLVAPGADPGDVRVAFDGLVPVPASDGGLEAKGGDGTFRLDPPIAYQDTPAGRVPVKVAFDIRGGDLRYDVGPHDPLLPLVIDPVIGYSSYLV